MPEGEYPETYQKPKTSYIQTKSILLGLRNSCLSRRYPVFLRPCASEVTPHYRCTRTDMRIRSTTIWYYLGVQDMANQINGSVIEIVGGATY